MALIKHILFLTLFLMFITIVAVADYSNASDRIRSEFDTKTTGYTQPYMHGPNKAIMSSWSNQNWSPERYGMTKSANVGDKMISRFKSSGLIQSLNQDKNGLVVIKVGDLFLRLADTDKYRILKTIDYAINLEDENRDYLAYAVKHQRSNQFLGIYSADSLQLQ